MTLPEMLNEVCNTIRLRGEEVIRVDYVNEKRNIIVISDKQAYMLKWQEEPFYSAGKIVFGVSGIGMTINHDLVSNWCLDPANAYRKTILFQWTGSGIYYSKLEDFSNRHKVYKQKGGETVKVILVSDLQRW